MTETSQRIILIVDDDAPTREMYAEVFRQNDFDVIEARDGVEGLEKASSHEGIDVIFTGIEMPRMDGFQLTAALKENPATAQIPVFVNSHLGREEDKAAAAELGVKDFIIRGIVPPREVVQRVLQSFESTGKSYLLKVDPYGYDGQMLISDLRLPDEFTCANCGSTLAVKLTSKSDILEAKIVCPNCEQTY